MILCRAQPDNVANLQSIAYPRAPDPAVSAFKPSKQETATSEMGVLIHFAPQKSHGAHVSDGSNMPSIRLMCENVPQADMR
jgi:hypothetical protein